MKESYWQNPIEWENHLFKEKIRSRNKNKKTASLVDAVETMKVCIYDCRKMCAKLYIEKDHIYIYIITAVQTVYKRIQGMERNSKIEIM